MNVIRVLSQFRATGETSLPRAVYPGLYSQDLLLHHVISAHQTLELALQYRQCPYRKYYYFLLSLKLPLGNISSSGRTNNLDSNWTPTDPYILVHI
jgi:hypothetical protein